RRARGGGAPGSDLCHAGAGGDQRRPHARARGPAVDGRARVLALRSLRRRPLRQDGPQRHRIRADGRLRRGVQRPAQGQPRKGRPRVDAETTPLANPEYYQFDFDLGDIAEVWRRGSVVASWLLDLTAAALKGDAGLEKFSGRVSDSGEGRWTLK